MTEKLQRKWERSLNNYTRLRQFAMHEDIWIIQQSRGEMSVNKLMKLTRSSREALDRRAGELGIQLYWRPKPARDVDSLSADELSRRKPKRDEDVELSAAEKRGDNPFFISERVAQKEYELWKTNHGERLYEELDLKRIRKAV